MVKKRVLDPLPLLDDACLLQCLEEHGVKALHATKIWKYVIQHAKTIQDIREIPGLPTGTAEMLARKFAITTSSVVQRQNAADGTVKLLVQLQDGHEVEAVIMKHSGRNTLCVSSQIGCQMACTFCATGTMGIVGDLYAGEIMEQLFHAIKIAPIRNIVFMGMGEPLNNYNAVLTAINAITDNNRFNLAPKHITLSTVGIIHRIRQLDRDAPQVRLALSLHAPTQDLRSQIVPSSKAFPLDKLMKAIDEHLSTRNRLVLIEYVMLHKVNDSQEVAHQLGVLLHGKSVHVNLIPYNTTDVEDKYQCPPDQTTREFQDILRGQYNLRVTVRENHGRDIDGACGQLAVKKLTNAKSKKELPDIEDLEKHGIRHSSTSNKQGVNAGEKMDAAAKSNVINGIIGLANKLAEQMTWTSSCTYLLVVPLSTLLFLGYLRAKRS